MRHRITLSALVCFALLAAPAFSAWSLPSAPTLKTWIGEMKKAPKGPFQRIRWFCKDGTVQPPKAYACKDHGGGIQHGEWSERTKSLRAGGYKIGNVLAAVNPKEFEGSDPNVKLLKQILLERFLVGWDNGWIFRKARSYRGALQSEDEEAGAKRIVLGMLADPWWRAPEHFMLLRETVRLFPLQTDEQTASEVRRLAVDVANKDSGFERLRAKIHNAPDADDAQSVRNYATKHGKKAAKADYEKLASSIDRLYQSGGTAKALTALAANVNNGDLKAQLERGAKALQDSKNADQNLTVASQLLAQIREAFPKIDPPEVALEALQTSLALEDDVYASGNTIIKDLDQLNRRTRIETLEASADALYGAGFLSQRQLRAVQDGVSRLVPKSGNPTLEQYRSELRYLARVPEWSDRWMAFNFGETVARWAPIEPEAHLYTQDRLRGSPLLVYGAIIDSLSLDANKLAGIRHELFGKSVGSGLRALNPGLAQGTLRTNEKSDKSVDSGGIYVLPETTADLPAVSGILTRGEGSSLSHVQLLARNLGIPNVVVGEEHMPVVNEHLGDQVVLAVSPGGIVNLDQWGPEWEKYFSQGKDEDTESLVIRPDLNKLDLTVDRLVTLSNLRATDSGKLSGPKGANLGELKYNFGDAVPNGFVIPFGIFRKLLDKPLDPGGPSVWDWMKERYKAVAAEKDPKKKQEMVAQFLGRLRNWLLNVDTGAAFKTELKRQLRESFGPDGTYGVFVRSDTNVEDLPGFTGAGLNLTVFNVVGYDNILKAIHEVWASPFDERAYGWRQSHMENPEYVFPAVVIQLAYAGDKSGVMVTTDIENQKPGWVSVALSEGVGGAVEGQATESVLIDTNKKRIRLLAQATAPEKTVLKPQGGTAHVPASGTSRLLQGGEALQLIALSKKVKNLDSLRDENGNMMPADMEFSFKDGRLALLQIRPFVESKSALTNPYLTQLDSKTSSGTNIRVPLNNVPRTSQ